MKKILGIVAAIVLVGVTSACDDSAALGSSEVKYEITGGAASSVTYGTAAGISQEADVKLPWSKTVTDDGLLTIATLDAQNAGSGPVSCKITIDGKVIAEQTSSGQFAVVSCFGSK